MTIYMTHHRLFTLKVARFFTMRYYITVVVCDAITETLADVGFLQRSYSDEAD